jgi:hypothetical protein
MSFIAITLETFASRTIYKKRGAMIKKSFGVFFW